VVQLPQVMLPQLLERALLHARDPRRGEKVV
jgi:hypothetical protein